MGRGYLKDGGNNALQTEASMDMYDLAGYYSRLVSCVISREYISSDRIKHHRDSIKAKDNAIIPFIPYYMTEVYINNIRM